MKTRKRMASQNDMKLFTGERLLVIVSLIGFLLAAVCALYIGFYGEVRIPEGNVKSAFSFNSAVAVFMLSMAALIPLSGLSPRKRARIRWGFIVTSLVGYGIETIQHFRGVNPRFARAGSTVDAIVGGLFGLTSFALVVVTIMLAVSFFRRRDHNQRAVLVLGIRYAFVSTMLAFAAGFMMIGLQGRFIGAEGNWIVIHGLGFHALQTLPIIGWLMERANCSEQRARLIMHWGGISWLITILLIGIQTYLGRTVFELTLLPLLAALSLFVWLASVAVSGLLLAKAYKKAEIRLLSKYR